MIYWNFELRTIIISSPLNGLGEVNLVRYFLSSSMDLPWLISIPKMSDSKNFQTIFWIFDGLELLKLIFLNNGIIERFILYTSNFQKPFLKIDIILGRFHMVFWWLKSLVQALISGHLSMENYWSGKTILARASRVYTIIYVLFRVCKL